MPSALTRTSPFGPWMTSYGTMVISSLTSSNLRPTNRLIEKIVFCGFVTCWRLAGGPTSRCPSFVNATTDGVVRPPSAFGMTVGSPPSSTAIQELVVPRSIPIVFAICSAPYVFSCKKSKRYYSKGELWPTLGSLTTQRSSSNGLLTCSPVGKCSSSGARRRGRSWTRSLGRSGVGRRSRSSSSASRGWTSGPSRRSGPRPRRPSSSPNDRRSG